jgi:hypothetical protein
MLCDIAVAATHTKPMAERIVFDIHSLLVRPVLSVS